MKIGILTHPLEANYGGLLQAYALQESVRRLGYDVEHIDIHIYPAQIGIPKQTLGFIRRCFAHFILQKNVSIKFRPNLSKKDYETIARNIKPFVRKYIKTSRCFEGLSSLSQIKESDYDTIIVGSDQVWIPSFCPEYFLSFTKGWNIRRIAYAASFGHSSWRFTNEVTQYCKELAHDFFAISLRESTGVELCEKYLNVNATHVLDPTLLLIAEDYKRFVQSSFPREKRVFTYVLDYTKEKQDIITLVAKSKHLDVYSPLTTEGLLTHKHIMPSVEEWLTEIYYSDFVVTDSFHGMVFSIIFNKQFVVIGNKERGMARFESLLNALGCEDRLVTSINAVESLLKLEVDYSFVNERLNTLRMESMSFLTNSLNG